MPSRFLEIFTAVKHVNDLAGIGLDSEPMLLTISLEQPHDVTDDSLTGADAFLLLLAHSTDFSLDLLVRRAIRKRVTGCESAGRQRA